MRLFCDACNEVELFTPGEVERIVYALVGMEADERCAVTPRLAAGRDAMLNTVCLRTVLGYSRDSEMYAEHTNAAVEARRKGSHG